MRKTVSRELANVMSSNARVSFAERRPKHQACKSNGLTVCSHRTIRPTLLMARAPKINSAYLPHLTSAVKYNACVTGPTAAGAAALTGHLGINASNAHCKRHSWHVSTEDSHAPPHKGRRVARETNPLTNSFIETWKHCVFCEKNPDLR